MTVNDFTSRHNGVSKDTEVQKMLQTIGVSSMDELIEKAVPAAIRLKEPMPLPAGMSGREAVVRFEFPGAYIDYTFTQGEGGGGGFLKGDVNNDGEVGIADVNALINLILGGEPTDDMMLIRADVNEDGEIGIADVNYLLTLI